MFAEAGDEVTTSQLIGFGLIGLVIILGLRAWSQFFQNTELREDMRESLRYLPEVEKPMTAPVALGCFLGYLALPAVYILIWSSMQQTENAELGELPQSVKLMHMVLSMGVQLVYLVVVLLVAHQQKLISLNDCGFHLKNIRQQVAYGWEAFLLAIPPVLIVLTLTAAFRSPDKVHDLFKVISEQATVTNSLLIALSVMLLAPLTEEIAFRVCMQGFVQHRHPSVAIVLTAFFFATIHGFPDSIPLLPLSLILGMLYYYRKSFLACFTTHALFNGYNLVIALLMNGGNS
ncbi:MAG: CPBP family intramembrane glutamic endopeptidase [Planctomycetaceae bacterium]